MIRDKTIFLYRRSIDALEHKVNEILTTGKGDDGTIYNIAKVVDIKYSPVVVTSYNNDDPTDDKGYVDSDFTCMIHYIEGKTAKQLVGEMKKKK